MRTIIATKLKEILSLLLLRLAGGPAGSRAELNCADLQGASLKDVNLQGAELKCADLRGARLQCVTLFRSRGNGKEVKETYFYPCSAVDTEDTE